MLGRVPDVARWLEDRREGREQPADDISAFVRGVVEGTVTRAQAAAWLAFVNCRGMTPAETAALTRAMTESGDRLTWPGIEGPFVDKHSTGGVGDKVSLVLAPVWVVLGCKVPMISGRGLGITGGTLDKLESIPGFRADLALDELRRVLAETGCFISGQTGELAPADRILYALRNETGTVPSIPLITASILSKKLVEGLDRLVLDVKWGSGAFMKTRAAAAELADAMTRAGQADGVEVRAVLSEMNEPLGDTVGNSLEVEEAVDTLKGGGPSPLRESVAELSGEPERARRVLDEGSAYEVFCRMVRAQGGDPEAPRHGGGCREEVVVAASGGTVSRCDAAGIGRAAFVLGAGRPHEGHEVHPGVGLRLHAHVGDAVERGQPLCTLLHAGRGLEEARAAVLEAYAVG